MKPFCKLFEFDDIGQVLATLNAEIAYEIAMKTLKSLPDFGL